MSSKKQRWRCRDESYSKPRKKLWEKEKWKKKKILFRRVPCAASHPRVQKALQAFKNEKVGQTHAKNKKSRHGR